MIQQTSLLTLIILIAIYILRLLGTPFPPPPTAKLKKKYTIIPQMNSELCFDRVRL